MFMNAGLPASVLNRPIEENIFKHHFKIMYRKGFFKKNLTSEKLKTVHG